MSTYIMSHCWPLQGMSPAQKSVLISLADNANDEGICWPSIARISQRTCISERAVRNAIRWLELSGILSCDSRNGRSTYYTITPASYAPAPDAPLPGTKCRGPRQDMPRTPAPNAPITVKEPSKEPKLNIGVQDLVADGLEEDVALELISHRKKKKADLTARAWNAIKREAERAGWPLQAAVEKLLERGWTGFEAKWVEKDVLPTKAGEEILDPRAKAPPSWFKLPPGAKWTPGKGVTW